MNENNTIIEFIGNTAIGYFVNAFNVLVGTVYVFIQVLTNHPAWWEIDSWTEVAAIVSIIFSALNFIFSRLKEDKE